MIKRLLSAFVVTVALMSQAWAQTEFQVNNPDGQKYEFGRSFITALSYLKNIDNRWGLNPPKKKYSTNEINMIKASIDYLTKDNADLRIVKNYMMKYVGSSNALMRKTADMAVVACDKGIALNNEEKKLWGQWLELKTTGQDNPSKERTFVRTQEKFSLSRKEIDKSFIEASILMTNVLKSQSNKDEKGLKLAITKAQRKKLLDKLDSFAKNIIDWGLKPGQRTLGACVSVIREVLEDPLWITSNG